jgi:methylated-DNA-[protein]-cysteine S-methyltransferase
MTQQLNYIIFNTDMGWVGVVSSDTGLRRIILPHPSEQEIRQQLGDSIGRADQSPHLFQDLMKRFIRYYNGHKVNFPDKLDLSDGTEFRRRVWEASRPIPYGETRSYGWVAEKIKQPEAARAVGQALGRNPLPIIVPCHRVLASGGGLGGFTSGLEMKKRLLRLEGAMVTL